MSRLPAACLLLGILAAACGAPVDAGAPAPTRELGCPETATMPADTVPADFTVAWVQRCRGDMRLLPGEGRWAVRIEERADTDAAALLAALRRPDEEAPGTVSCPSIKIVVADFALVAADGTVVRPRVPLNVCGQPQKAARDALAALPWHEVGLTRLNLDVSQESLDTGCGQAWGEFRPGEFGEKPAPALRPMWAKKPESLQVCLYRPEAVGYPSIIGSGTIKGAEMTALVARLDVLPAARPCRAGHRFWVAIQYTRRGWYGDTALAEVDGCRRILRPDHTIGQLDPATAKALEAIARR